MEPSDQVDSKPHVETPALPPPAPKRRGGLLATIALLISLLSLGSVIYLGQCIHRLENQRVARDQQLRLFLDKKLSTVETQFSQQEKLLNHVRAELQAGQRKTALLDVEEAESLLIRAQNTLLFEPTSPLVIKFITEADQRLVTLNDPAIAPVRKILAESLVMFTATKLDTAGVLAQLFTLRDQIVALSLSALPSSKPITKSGISHKPTWEERLWENLSHLSGLVSVRRLDESIKPLPSPEQRVYANENIKLQFSQAMWAVLHQQPILYQKSLLEAKKLLQQNYGGQPMAAQLIATIDRLAKINIKPNVPDLSQAIMLLRQYVQRMQSVQPPLPTPPVNVPTKPPAIAPQVVPATPARALPS